MKLTVGLLSLLCIIIIFSILIGVTYAKFPVARSIRLSRADNESKFLAVLDVSVYNDKAQKLEISEVTGDIYPSGFADNTTSTALTAIKFGTTLLYFADDTSSNTAIQTQVTSNPSNRIGPCYVFMPANVSKNGTITFKLSCANPISKISVKPLDTTLAKSNMQRVKIELLDKDSNVIPGVERVTPTVAIPRTVHYVTYGPIE